MANTSKKNQIQIAAEELNEYLKENSIDVMLLQETHLKQDTKFKFCNFITYRRDRGNKRRGGVAIIFKRTIEHDELPNPETEELEAIGIGIKDYNGGKLKIYSYYIKLEADLKVRDLEKLFIDDTPCIAVGDFNVKSRRWNRGLRKKKSKILEEFIDNRINIVVHGPEEPTHYPPQEYAPNVLDIFITKNITQMVQLEPRNALNSDHMPVHLNLVDMHTHER